MKILNRIPSILIPALRMDSVLNMHVTIPLLPADDFIMYGKTIIMAETGVLNDNICTNMLFALESVYSEEMNRYGFRDFWLPAAKEQLLDISALVGRQILDPEDIFEPLATLDFPIHMSDIIWRRDFSDNGEGSRVYYGVYPDDNTIPVHNFLTGKPVGKGHSDILHSGKDLWGADGNTERHVFYYYEPLYPLKVEGDPDDPLYYREFQHRCDPGIYKWIKGLMSGLMIYSADTVAAVMDMACISDLENKPDESAFPDGDVFTSADRTPIKKLCAGLRVLPQAALVPHKKIWTAAQFEKYLPNEVKKVLEDAALHGTEINDETEGSINRAVLDSMAAGRLVGLDGGKYRNGILADITRDTVPDIPGKTSGGVRTFDLSPSTGGKDGKTAGNVSKQLFPRFTPTPEQIAEKERGLADMDIDPGEELLLERAFVNDKEEYNKKECSEKNDDLNKNEQFLEKAFMESGKEHRQRPSKNTVGLHDRKADKQAEDPMNLISEAEKTGSISKLLDSAFLGNGIE